MQVLEITRPDDWHVHFRDEATLQHTVKATATHFARALVMPNLSPALTRIDTLIAYRERILSVLGTISSFTPYMSLYLNATVELDELARLKEYPFILGAKFYPAGATTNSAEGARTLRSLYPLLEILQDNNLVLQIHGEVTHGDIFARERLFIEEELTPLLKNFTKLRVVLEHISSQAAVDFVRQGPSTLAATITPHHLWYNRNQLLVGGIKPHFYCLPILKHLNDQRALQEAVISGHPRLFAGTDSAPHVKAQKESACGCAGIYSAPFALAFYAEMFDQLGQLTKLNDFMSRFGAEFYQLPITQERMQLIKRPQQVPEFLAFGPDHVVPMGAGTTLPWSVDERS
jgi:dihydroorotase